MVYVFILVYFYKYSKILLNSYPKTISFLKKLFFIYLLYNPKNLIRNYNQDSGHKYY